MQQYSALKTFTKYWIFIVVVTVVAVAAAIAAGSQNVSTTYGSIAVTAQALHTYPTGGPLILQPNASTDTLLVVSTTQSWIGDPSYVKEILSKGGVSDTDLAFKDLGKVFKVVSPVANSGSYQVQYSSTSSDEVLKVLSSLKSVTGDLVNQYNASTDHELRIRLLYSEPVVTTQSSGLPIGPIAGGVAGFVFALAIAAILERKEVA